VAPPISSVVLLSTRADAIQGLDPNVGPAEQKLGGVRIYGPNLDVIEKATEDSLNLIKNEAGSQTSIDPNYLFNLFRQNLGGDKKIFGAFLNNAASHGHIDFVRCRSLYGRSFRLVVEHGRSNEFREQVCSVIDRVRPRDLLPIRNVQDQFFPNRGKGTWFIAQNILQRVAYLGYLEQLDKWNFQVPKGLSNALSDSNWKLLHPNVPRLV
jgi:hypothetical protein